MCILYILVIAFPWWLIFWANTFFPGVPLLIFGFHFWIVVFSVYRDIKKETYEAVINDDQEMETQA